MNSKGASGGMLPMVILLVGTVVFGYQAIQISEGLTNQATLQMDDLSRVSETNSKRGQLLFDYLEQAAEFATHQNTEELGNNGGGVRWTSEELELGPTLQLKANMEIVDDIQKRYESADVVSECGINSDSIDVTFPPQENLEQTRNINGTVNVTQDLPAVECSFPSGSTASAGEPGSFLATYNASWNRYFQLAGTAQDDLEQVRDEWNAEDERYREAVQQCGSTPSDQQAIDAAESAAEQELESALDEAISGSLDGGLQRQKVEISDIDYEVVEVTAAQDVGDCSCEQVCTSPDDSPDGSDSGGGQGDFGEELGGDPAGSDGSDSGSDSNFDDGSTSSGGLFSGSLPSFFGDYSSITGKQFDSEFSSGGNDGSTDNSGSSTDSGSDGGSGTSSGSGGEDQSCTEVCDKDTFEKEAEINLQSVKLQYDVEDTEYRVPVEDGWENLNFEAEYEHDFGGLNVDLEQEQVQGLGTVYTSLMDGGAEPVQYAEQNKIYTDQEAFRERFYGEEFLPGKNRQGLIEVPLKQAVRLPNGDVMQLYAESGSWRKKLFFRSNTGGPAGLCSGGSIYGTPVDMVSQDVSTVDSCYYSGNLEFASGTRGVTICGFDEQEDVATVAMDTTDYSSCGSENTGGFGSGSVDGGGDGDGATDTGAGGSTGDLPSVTDDGFEAALRGRVGAKEGRAWQAFCDPEGRTVYNVTEEPYNADVGGDVSSRVQAAIDDAAKESPSGIVYLPSGTYEFTVEVHHSQDGVCIVGDGKDTHVKGADAMAVETTDGSYGFFDEENVMERFTLANIRFSRVGAFRSHGMQGKSNRIENIWVEGAYSLGIDGNLPGTTYSDITMRKIGGHAFGLNNGNLANFDGPVEDYCSEKDLNPVSVRRVHVNGAGLNIEGRHKIDASDGCHMTIDTFLVEGPGRHITKSASVHDVKWYDGLFLDGDGDATGMYTYKGGTGDIYLDDVKFRGAKTGLSFRAGNIFMGDVVISKSTQKNMRVLRDADVTIEHLVSNEAGGDGLFVGRDGYSGETRIQKLNAKNNGDCDVENQAGSNLVVETLEADKKCGSIPRQQVDYTFTR